MSTNAIVLLRNDHQEIRRQFKRFEQAGDNATAGKATIVDKIIELLTVHTYLENVTHHMDEEEQDWFPQVRAGLGRKQLQELGARMNELRPQAPTRPEQPSALKKAVDAVIS